MRTIKPAKTSAALVGRPNSAVARFTSNRSLASTGSGHLMLVRRCDKGTSIRHICTTFVDTAARLAVDEREQGVSGYPLPPPSAASRARSGFQLRGNIAIVGPPPNLSSAHVIKPAARVTASLRMVPANPNLRARRSETREQLEETPILLPRKPR